MYYRLVDPEGTKWGLIELGVPFRARTAAAAS
jgi:hypothetical protein